ncbi:MAG: thiosulfate oxidation carrier complex protein SoxZ [Terriglobia bacterium]
MANTRIQIPAKIKRGDVVEVRLLIRHPMETGFRHDNVGRPIPQNVIKLVTCRYNGEEIFRAELFSGVAANPYLVFFTTASKSGELEVTWTDDTGQTETERMQVTVV